MLASSFKDGQNVLQNWSKAAVKKQLSVASLSSTVGTKKMLDNTALNIFFFFLQNPWQKFLAMTKQVANKTLIRLPILFNWQQSGNKQRTD